MTPAAGTSRDRVRAARILVDIVYHGKTTDQSFGRIDSEEDVSPLLQELIYGTLRYYFCLEPLLTGLLSTPLRTKDLDLRCLMLVGAYQLHYMRIPDHAAIYETVNACRGLKKPWARGLVNAVLRKVVDQKPDERSFGMPDWLYAKVRADYPHRAEAIGRASLGRAPMSLRVNRLRTSVMDYRSRLATAGRPASEGLIPEHLILESPVAVRQLPGHAEGEVSVQDGGALLAAGLLCGTPPPRRILDACAAPGGKLFHLAERAPEATVVGIERSAARFDHLTAEARRLGHDRVVLRLGDATGADWLGEDVPDEYDAILLDAPCSGSGTLRRHPDIKVLRRPEDLPVFAALQRRLLDNLWRFLAPDGVFLYCTCSFFPEENDRVVEDFLAAHPEAACTPISLPTGEATAYGWQLLTLPPPGDGPDLSTDGFYFARLTRREKAR